MHKARKLEEDLFFLNSLDTKMEIKVTYVFQINE